jgi:hypothetical protein
VPLQVEITSVEITSTQVRRVAAGLAAGLATGVALLGIFDILKPARAPSAGMLLCHVLVPTMVPGLVALLAYLAGGAWVRRNPNSLRAARWKRGGMIAGSVFLLPLWLLCVEAWVYEPLKFAILIHRVENAQTIEAEQAAFRAAHRWGYVWELHRLTNKEWWPKQKRHLSAPWLLELEWLETSGWSGQPYRAYRVVLDERNFEVMARK